jgi:hypothetical protein
MRPIRRYFDRFWKQLALPATRADCAGLVAILGFAILLCAPVLTGRVPVATDTLSLWGPRAEFNQVAVHNPVLADSALQYLPAQIFVRRSLAGGEWPLWNPDLFSGYPFMATDENQLYYPIAWLLLALPLSLALQVSVIFHVWLAGAGMYLLVRLLGAGRAGSLISALAFAGSGQLYTAIEITGVADIYGWLPWILVAAEIAWRRRSWLWTAVAGLLSGVMAVSGHLPWYLYGGAFLALWLAAHLVVEALSVTGWQSARQARLAKHAGVVVPMAPTMPTMPTMPTALRTAPRGFWGQLARSTAILAWGPALAAIHLLPFLQMVTFSSRIKAAGFAVSPTGLQDTLGLLGNQLTIFVPQMLGTSVGGVGNPLNFNNCWYIGLAPLVLACMALLLRRERKVLFLGVVGVVAFAVAAGLPVFNAISQLPGLQTQIPGRTAYLFIVCMSVLAGLGFDTALDLASRRPLLWAVLSILVFCSGVLVAYLLLQKHSQSASQPALYSLQSVALRQTAFIAVALLLWLLAVYGLLSLRLPGRQMGRAKVGSPERLERPENGERLTGRARLAAMRSTKWVAGGGVAWRRAMLAGILIVITAIDLLSYAPNYNTYASPDTLYPHSAAADLLRSDPGLWRIIAPDAPAITFPPNSSTLYGLHDVQGYDSLHFQRYDNYWAAVDKSASSNASDYFNVQLRPQSYLSAQARLLNAEYVTTYYPLAEVRQTNRSFDLGELANNPLAQSFQSPAALASLEYAFDTRGRVNHAPVILHVRRTLTDTQDLVTQVVDPSTWTGKPWISFNFAPLPTKEGQQLVALLETSAKTPGDSVSVLGEKGVFYHVGPLYEGGKWRQRSVAFIAKGMLPAQLKLAYEGDVTVYTDTAALPRAFVVASAQVVSTTRVLACMAQPDFDPRRTVLIEQDPPSGFNSPHGGCASTGNQQAENGPSGNSSSDVSSDSGPAGSAAITSYRNLSVDITADMVRPGWLVLGDVNYPGWHAQVDGREAPLYTADYVVRAVPLSAGSHTVHFYFLPTTVLAGGAISGLALLLALSVIMGSWVGLRRPFAPSSGAGGGAPGGSELP